MDAERQKRRRQLVYCTLSQGIIILEKQRNSDHLNSLGKKKHPQKTCVSKITTAKATISKRAMTVLTPVRQILQTHTEDA